MSCGSSAVRSGVGSSTAAASARWLSVGAKPAMVSGSPWPSSAVKTAPCTRESASPADDVPEARLLRATSALSASIRSMLIRAVPIESRVVISSLSTLSSRYSRIAIALHTVAATTPTASRMTFARVSLARRE